MFKSSQKVILKFSAGVLFFSALCITQVTQAQVRILSPENGSVLPDNTILSGSCTGSSAVNLANGQSKLKVSCVNNSWRTSAVAKSKFSLDQGGHVIVTANQGSQSDQKSYLKAAVVAPPISPTVSFSSPADGTRLTSAQVANVDMQGFCNIQGQVVTVSAAGVSATSVCGFGLWGASLNLTNAPAGTILVEARFQNAQGTQAQPARLNLIKLADEIPVINQLAAGPSYLDQINTQGQVIINAASIAEAVTSFNAAAANTIIKLPAGTFTNQNISLSASGLASKPIIFQGQANGSTIFSGKFNLTATGAHIIIKNIQLKNYDSKDYGGSSTNFYFKNCRFCGLYNSNLEVSIEAHMVDVLNEKGEVAGQKDENQFKNIMIDGYSQSVEIGMNTFKTKRNGGSSVVINRLKNRATMYEGHRIFKNLFTGRELQGDGANDFDSIRVGDSSTSQSPSRESILQALAQNQNQFVIGNMIEYNIFEDTQLAPATYQSCEANNTWKTDACAGEPEIISVKAPNTGVRFNVFRHNSGGLTLRHGYLSVIEGNYFSGQNSPRGISDIVRASYGVRIIGENQLVVNNHFENLNASSKMLGGITVVAGQLNPELKGYWPVFNSIIAFNFMSNVGEKPIGLAADYGKREKTVLPIQVVIENNVVNGAQQVYTNMAPNEQYLSTFSLKNNFQDSSLVGLAVANASAKVLTIQTTLGASGFHVPNETAYVGSAGVLKASTAAYNQLLVSLGARSDASVQADMENLTKLTKIGSGTLYDRYVPLSTSEVGFKN